MNTAMLQTDSFSGGTAHAQRAIAIHKLVASTDQVRLKEQVLRSTATAIVSLIGTIAVFLFILFGPALAEQAAVFTVFLLVVFGCMFVISVFALATPVLDVLTLNRLTALRKDIECCDLFERNQELGRILREVDASSDPRSVLIGYRESIETLTHC
jgi:hypothetical protein